MAKGSYFPNIMLLFVFATVMSSTIVNADVDIGLANNLCGATRYKDLCMKSLNESGANLNDPKEILKVSFKVTKDQIIKGINESAAIQDAKKDPRSAEALEICRQVMEYSVNDLERTINSTDEMQLANLDVFIEDLRIWIGGVITYQEVCFDAFKDIRTDTGRKIREFFNESRQLSSNALTICTDIKEFLGKYKDVGSALSSLLGAVGSGRTLQEKKKKGWVAGEPPAWVNNPKRKVMGVPVATITPDAVVAQDGSGQYLTLGEAIAKVPLKSMEPFIIYLKAGIYKEYNVIPKQAWNVILIGDGPDKTVISGDKSVTNVDKSKQARTFNSAPLGVDGEGFMARDIKFENTAGAEGHQAVALRVASDLAVFHNCVFDAYQDTLYSLRGRQFYRDCTIAGTVDYTFGDAQAVYQNCQFIINKPLYGQDCLVTAQGRTEANGPGGYVLQGCRITGSPAYKAFQNQPGKGSYLGRPWKAYSRTIVMNSFIDNIISPEGWRLWDNETFHLTADYAEFANTGPGADISKRVKWPHFRQLTPKDAEQYTPGKLFVNPDVWIPNTGVPFAAGTFAAQ